MFAGGVDVGSTQTKSVILDDQRQICGRSLIDTGAVITEAARNAFAAALSAAGITADQVAHVVGTGYGRYNVTFGDSQVTEISCHARGAKYLFPSTQTVLDIGGQDTKAIRVGDDAQVLDFSMNDKCAAGTGRFLGAAAFALDRPLSELGPLALQSRNPVKITTTCTVFAESEIINWLARGKKTEDVLMGVHRGIAQRSLSLLRRVGVQEQVTFTGGVTRNVAMIQILEEMLGTHLNVSPDAHYMGAIGAALFALERAAESPDLEPRLEAQRKAGPDCSVCPIVVEERAS